MIEFILYLIDRFFPRKRKGRGVLSFHFSGIKAIGAHKMIFPSDTQTLNAAVSFVDGRGNPARVDGVPAWEMTGDPIGSVEPAADGLSAVITLNGSIGIAQVSIRADADLDAGEERELIVTGELEIVAAEAVSGSVTFTPV